VIDFIGDAERSTKENGLSPESISLPIVPFSLISILSVTTTRCIILDSPSAFWSNPLVNININSALILFITILIKLLKHRFSSFWSQTVFHIAIRLEIIPRITFTNVISIISDARLVVYLLHTELK